MKNIDKILHFIDPPGCLTNTLRNPGNKNESIELALFQEHRFAFYYWLKWTNAQRNNVVPSLITFDWHQDLCQPYKDQIEELENLDVNNKVEVALYSWGKLSHNNDVQIHAAIMHNKIKDVYVICRQNVSRNKIEVVKDFKGNNHVIYIFRNVEELMAEIPKINTKAVYLDIDLDYFTLSNPLSLHCPYKQKKYTYMKKKEIVSLLTPENRMMQWIFDRLKGFTIATEPKFCGGLNKSNYFLQIIDNLYFAPSLFYLVPGSATEYTKWKHLL